MNDEFKWYVLKVLRFKDPFKVTFDFGRLTNQASNDASNFFATRELAEQEIERRIRRQLTDENLSQDIL